MHVLIAEDENRIAHSLSKSFRMEGHQVTITGDGAQTLAMLENKSFDVLLLDWRMPHLTGIEVCRQLREQGNTIPIILLTALADISNKVEALNLGADDYITKPFSFEEVYARMQAVMRRSRGEAKRIIAGQIELDLVSHTLRKNEQSLKLPEMEFELLRYLVENKELIINKEQLSRDVWKLPFLPDTNFIEATIKNLRKKLETLNMAHFVKTIYGEGYTFIDDED